MYLNHQDIAQYEMSHANAEKEENDCTPTEENVLIWTEEMINEQEELGRCLETHPGLSTEL
jgi:hypothetical protein